MTQTPHDSFAKKYLSDLFVSSGEVKPGREVYGETQQVDLWFEPAPDAIPALRTLGTLGQIASTFCLIEPFRNAVQIADVQNCAGKLFNVYAELRRRAKREKTPIKQVVLPRLWLITPTASAKVLQGFGATEDIDWGRGIYFTATQFQAAFVVLHQVPDTLETLWLRLMGRGSVQGQAIDELLTLQQGHPFRQITLEHLANLQITLQTRQNLNRDERELTVNLSPVYEKWREETVGQARREEVEALLAEKFGSLDTALTQIVPALLQLSSLDE